MRIIGISARKRRGKDTVAEYLIEHHGFQRYSFADPLKRGAMELFGFTEEQMWGDLKEVVDPRWNMTPRRVLQLLGTQLLQFDIHKHLEEGEFTYKGEPIGRTIWVHRFRLWIEDEVNKIKEEFGDDAKLLVSIADVRFPHEAEPIRELGGEIWKIERPSLDQQETNSMDEHASEMEVDNIKEDKLIINDGTLEELYEKIEKNL